MRLLHRITDDTMHPVDAARRCPALLESWLRHAPRSQPSAYADFEDWAEPAAILAAMSRHGDVTLLPPGPPVRMTGDTTPLVRARPGSPEAIMWGRFLPTDSNDLPADVDLVWNGGRQVRRVQDYATSPVFLAHVGRDFHVCDMTDASVSRAVVALRNAGHARGFVKTRDKGETSSFDVPRNGDTGHHLRMGLQDPYVFAIREGDKDCVYVQQAIRPTREYRIFVVGDEIVTGAGCIVEHTPCDGRGDAFDVRVEVDRGSGTIVEDDLTVARYVAYAASYARAWATGHGHDMGYALDLCIDADDDTVQVVEMNPLANVGLYAIDADALVDAMIHGAREVRPA